MSKSVASTENEGLMIDRKKQSQNQQLDSKSNPDSTTPGGNNIKVHWSDENEKILVEWCDIAQCYKWLNARSHERLSYMHAWFTIPAIVLSTISGTASFAQSSLPEAYQLYSPMAIGGINIFIGILTTVQQYLKISELNEAHRVSSIAWDKFARNIRIELAKIPDERMDAGSFIKLCRQEFDRLMETSPMIHQKITREFNKKFSGGKDTKAIKNFKKLKKPDICDTITSVSEVRNKWYLQGKELYEDNEETTDSFDLEDNTATKANVLELQQLMLKERDDQLKKIQKEESEKTKKILQELETLRKSDEENRIRYDEQSIIIKNTITEFENVRGRPPAKQEICDMVKDQVDSDILNKFIEMQNHSDDNV
jgi:hypothetical protein